MAILIKGMEMPHCEIVTIRISPDGEVHYIGAVGQSAKRARAIEIPPHGRLIDADALLERLQVTAIDPVPSWIRAEIIIAPTIIEAEE